VAGRLTPAGSPYEVKAGSVIPCTLIRGINSDLPGDTLCHVRQNVFDTVTGDYLLIPQGTRAIGEYDSATNFGISRVLTVWHRLVFPNGKSIALEGMPGVDLSGYAGYKDRVNQHWGKLTASVILSTIFSAAPVIAAGDVENYQATVDQEIARNVGANINQAGQQIVERSLSVKPTIEIRPGFAVNIFVQKDLPLEPYESTIRGELSLGTHHPTNEGG
jgi:type IV secretory pathway VirB10-like protein